MRPWSRLGGARPTSPHPSESLAASAVPETTETVEPATTTENETVDLTKQPVTETTGLWFTAPSLEVDSAADAGVALKGAAAMGDLRLPTQLIKERLRTAALPTSKKRLLREAH